ncbi:MAG: hypothetical protein JXL80_03135 [Planctomycetes bacterium]|nr:hypothetical protein [Planctomycetota bacterium]
MTTTLHNTATVLDRVREHLDQGQPQKALDVLNRCQDQSPPADNARAVCLMRLGRPQLAIPIYRRLLLTSGVIMRQDAPVMFRVNFATALLMTGNLDGTEAILTELRHSDDPGAIRLRETIARWRQSLRPLRRLLAAMGMPPEGAIPLDFPPGRV